MDSVKVIHPDGNQGWVFDAVTGFAMMTFLLFALLGVLHTRDYTVNSKYLFPVYSIRSVGHKEPVHSEGGECSRGGTFMRVPSMADYVDGR